MLVYKIFKLFLVMLPLVIQCFGGDGTTRPDAYKWSAASGSEVPVEDKAAWFLLADNRVSESFAAECERLVAAHPVLLETSNNEGKNLIHLCIDQRMIAGVIRSFCMYDYFS